MKAFAAILSIATGLGFASCHHTAKKDDANSYQNTKVPKFDFNYKVLKKIKIGGEGGWDYAAFDTVNRRLYLSHSTKVDILDVDKEQVIGEIPNTPGVHGIAFAYDLNKGFTSNGKDSSVTVFDLKEMKVTGRIKVTGANPDCILYDPFSKRIFTFNGKSNNATVIDAQSGNIVGTLNLKGKPEFAATNGNGRIYDALEDTSEVVIIDPKRLEVMNWVALDSSKEPSGMSFDPTYKRLFVGCGSQRLAVLNSDNCRTVSTYPIGDHVDATAFNPDTRMVFSSNGDGTLTIFGQIDEDSLTKPVNIQTQKGARTMAIDIKKDRIYLPVADYGAMEESKDGKKPRPSIVPGSFSVLVVGKQ